MKKVFSMMLAAVMLFALAVSAGAAEVSSEAGNEISPQYVALSTLSPTLTFSGKNVTCAVLANEGKHGEDHVEYDTLRSFIERTYD